MPPLVTFTYRGIDTTLFFSAKEMHDTRIMLNCVMQTKFFEFSTIAMPNVFHYHRIG